jgi:hypothetical protein
MISRCMESPPVALHTGNNLSPLWRSSKIKKKPAEKKPIDIPSELSITL